MQNRQMQASRLSTFHSTKRQLLGNQAGSAAPAWRVSVGGGMDQAKDKHRAIDPGSKIFLSRLPTDVDDREVEELFRKTVGPLKESFIIYNSQGKSKGMAVVSFQRAADAEVARLKYDGKIVDGRRPIKIEIITDQESLKKPHPSVPSSPSLLSRLGGVTTTKIIVAESKSSRSNGVIIPARPKPLHVQSPNTRAANIPKRRRQKKGPRRVNKSLTQLDQEMEDYRASAIQS